MQLTKILICAWVLWGSTGWGGSGSWFRSWVPVQTYPTVEVCETQRAQLQHIVRLVPRPPQYRCFPDTVDPR